MCDFKRFKINDRTAFKCNGTIMIFIQSNKFWSCRVPRRLMCIRRLACEMREEEETAQNVSFIHFECNRVEPIIIDSAQKQQKSSVVCSCRYVGWKYSRNKKRCRRCKTRSCKLIDWIIFQLTISKQEIKKKNHRKFAILSPTKNALISFYGRAAIAIHICVSESCADGRQPKQRGVIGGNDDDDDDTNDRRYHSWKINTSYF